jgi:ubiquinone/menaquinone biosynthesis C-methylase UbiE
MKNDTNYSQEELLKQCPKPEGDIGRFVGIKMNERHLPLWEWGLSYITINDDDMILDAGCGGGEAIKLLARHSTKGMIFGIDHSEEMVKLSKETNKDLIDRNRVIIYESSISKLSFSDNTFDLVTAFETYSFWPDLINDFQEVRRVLKPGGIFIIVHSAYKHESFEERNNYWNKVFGIQIHSPEEINDILMNSQFISIQVFEKIESYWLTIVARKSDE